MFNSAPDDLDEDARRWGIDPALLAPPETEEAVWAEHEPAVAAFLAIQNQWRVSIGMSGLIYHGLDYGACEAGLRLSGIATTPALWTAIRVIETAACNAMNGVSA